MAHRTMEIKYEIHRPLEGYIYGFSQFLFLSSNFEKQKLTNIQDFFLQKLKKVETEKIVFYDVTCDPIEI